ncbi:MAG: methionyl-tRNA formyltransferase, partial [Planctomycetes bacterium]|nr:methionyl-tRNA formyltransferase [Planctomycetota bacterium]
MRLVFLGSPPFATPVLARLTRSRFKPLCVVTQPARAQGRGHHGRGRKLGASAVAELARAEGIELLEPETVRDPAVLAHLGALAPDVFLVVSYGEILREEFLSLARIVALNVHPSLLPRHRGATPIPAALLAGDELTGVAIQKVAKELDSGDLLLSRATPIAPGETAGELLARLSEWSAELVLEALELVESGKARYQPQDSARATICKKLTKEHGRIDWTRPARELERRVRAMNPWPGATTRLASGAELLVWRALATSAEGGSNGAPGTILEAGPRWRVAAGDG